MRKKIFLSLAIFLIVLTLIIAFENILTQQQYYLLFFQFNANSTIIILLSAILGFLIGFFAMLYSVEIAKEKSRMAEEDLLGTPVVQGVEAAPEIPAAPTRQKKTPPDEDFDEDDEVLG
ncbi:MAG: hypothetical protein Q8O95_01020 [bacterium]|nr:hypothetical protein [bacterium]